MKANRLLEILKRLKPDWEFEASDCMLDYNNNNEDESAYLMFSISGKDFELDITKHLDDKVLQYLKSEVNYQGEATFTISGEAEGGESATGPSYSSGGDPGYGASAWYRYADLEIDLKKAGLGVIKLDIDSLYKDLNKEMRGFADAVETAALKQMYDN
jgi:hypothetical protein